ncbi:unannotated protein [freshwater metagenome]|uniref:Unannotated protein n=1 Tax=freshwater metagenome TaxID=449393 RepID=A0A6J7ERL0_9ZZZZ|nr:hypothetical protein [Actinomycetota bacterium]
MRQAADITAIIVATLGAVIAIGGAWAWWRASSGRWFWALWRVAQLSTTALAAVALIALLTGFDPGAGLFWLYMVLPIAVSIIAEQLRAASAQTILDQRELEDAQAVGRLPAEDQHRIVYAILARETWIIALAGAVIAFLALRAIATG